MDPPRIHVEPLYRKGHIQRGNARSATAFNMLPSMTAIVLFTVLVAIYYIKRRGKLSRLPPGPPPLPVIGNLHQAPKEYIWLAFKNWIDQYGPLVSVDFAGTRLVLIGDYETAHNLLDKRSSIYSSRPRMVSNHQV